MEPPYSSRIFLIYWIYWLCHVETGPVYFTDEASHAKPKVWGFFVWSLYGQSTPPDGNSHKLTWNRTKMCQFLICWSHINGEGVCKVLAQQVWWNIRVRDMPKTLILAISGAFTLFQHVSNSIFYQTCWAKIFHTPFPLIGDQHIKNWHILVQFQINFWPLLSAGSFFHTNSIQIILQLWA